MRVASEREQGKAQAAQRKTRTESERGQRKDWFKFLGRIQQCNIPPEEVTG